MDYRPDHSLAGGHVTLAGKTALVTGATGFVGGALVRRLVAEGVCVRALARDTQRADYIRSLDRAEIVVGDITDSAQMQAIAQGCDLVFHIAAATNGQIGLQRQVNVEGTRNLALAAVRAGVERFVHVSTLAVYGFRIPDLVTEDQPLAPGRDPYNITKAGGETALREIAAAYDLPFSIIRPGIIYGPRSGMWTGALFRLARLRPTPWFGDGSGTAPAIHIDDLMQQVLIQAAHPAATGEAFHCVSDPPPTWRAFLMGYAKLAGHNRWLAIPPVVARLVAPVIETALALRGEPKDVPDLAAFSQRRVTYSMDKARRLLGWEPQIDLEAGIASCAPWLRQRGWLA